ncbi:hypothetical protein [Streptomyces tubercidicus]|nr:hypothetical protein [Streptomyces tubercidicus]WAU10652.1 hypothetical protein STRTU_000752 [Streptomyces tubercidicus]
MRSQGQTSVLAMLQVGALTPGVTERGEEVGAESGEEADQEVLAHHAGYRERAPTAACLPQQGMDGQARNRDPGSGEQHGVLAALFLGGADHAVVHASVRGVGPLDQGGELPGAPGL